MTPFCATSGCNRHLAHISTLAYMCTSPTSASVFLYHRISTGFFLKKRHFRILAPLWRHVGATSGGVWYLALISELVGITRYAFPKKTRFCGCYASFYIHKDKKLPKKVWRKKGRQLWRKCAKIRKGTALATSAYVSICCHNAVGTKK